MSAEPRNAATRVYFGIAGVAAFAQACAFTLGLVYQIQTVGLGPLQLVLVGTTLEVVCLLAQVPTGLIADLISRRLSVIIGFALVGAGVMLEGLVPTFASVVAANVIWGIGITCVDGALEAWAADEIGEDRVGLVFTRGAQLGQAATVLGVFAAVGLASIRLNLALIGGATVWLLLAAVLTIVMREHGFTPAPRGQTGSWRAMADQVGATRQAVRGRTVLLCLFAATAFLALGSEGFDRLGSAHFLHDLGFPSIATPVVWFGAMSIVANIGTIGLTEVIRRRADLLSPAAVGRALTGLEAVRTVFVLVFALAGQFWWAAAAWLLSELVRDAVRPLMSTWMVAETESATRATVISTVGMVDATGQIFGGPPIGLLGQRLSVRAALVAAGLLAVPAIGFLAAAARRERGRTPVQSGPTPAERSELSAR